MFLNSCCWRGVARFPKQHFARVGVQSCPTVAAVRTGLITPVARSYTHAICSMPKRKVSNGLRTLVYACPVREVLLDFCRLYGVRIASGESSQP